MNTHHNGFLMILQVWLSTLNPHPENSLWAKFSPLPENGPLVIQCMLKDLPHNPRGMHKWVFPSCTLLMCTGKWWPIRMLLQTELQYSGFISFIAKKIPQYKIPQYWKQNQETNCALSSDLSLWSTDSSWSWTWEFLCEQAQIKVVKVTTLWH